MNRRIACVVIAFLSLLLSLAAQTSGSPASAQVPPLIQFSNVATDEGGNSLSGPVSITFSLYIAQRGGEPLWTETQSNVALDSTGHYSVQLGITKSKGVPTALFVSGEARWMGVRVAEQAEQPRVLLLSVPYALKAGDAATIGGLPPSAFVLAAPQNGAASAFATDSATGQSAPPPSGAVTGTGSLNFLPLWDSTSDIGSSALFQSGTGSTARIGINNIAPVSTLDVKGTTNLRGRLTLPAGTTATATRGGNSQPLTVVASAFNSGTAAAVNQSFQWQAEPINSNTATPSGTLNLLFAQGAGAFAETGLNIAANGQIAFAAGQTFPGTGTIAGITTASGSGLSGGGTSGTLSLSLLNTCAASQTLQWNGSSWGCATISGGGTITGVTAGTDLTGGGASGTVTLNVDTTRVPGLASANTFTNTQTINNTTIISGTDRAGVLQVTNTQTSGNAPAIVATTDSPHANGIKGIVNATSGPTAGLYGQTSSPTGQGVYGAGGTGVEGVASIFIAGGAGGNFHGYSAPAGSFGNGNDGIDVFGGSGDQEPPDDSLGGNGIVAFGGDGGFGGSAGAGIQGFGGSARDTPNAGGQFTGGQDAFGDSADGIDATVALDTSFGYAGNFTGDLNVTGAIFAGTKDFKIDHPLDPANQYLFHASVESSEMMNLYSGNVTTDARGEAQVQLPDWFEALNADFRYQLTVIGQFAQAIVAQKVANHQFRIRTSSPNVEVSWQITGIRQDAFAKANPLVVEQAKSARERGYYIHPSLYGTPEEKAIEWVRNPAWMQKRKALRDKVRSQHPTQSAGN